jgi:hypothetical protein
VNAIRSSPSPVHAPTGACLPHAELHLLDAGHFALETHAPEIAALMRDFLGRHLGGRAVEPRFGATQTAVPVLTK